jgi:aspartate carbamoyltransferase catalytic subunit
MNLISIRDLKKEEVEKLLDLAAKIEAGKHTPDLKGKILATLFFEPSTRTKLSFQSAAMRCGMRYLDFDADTSSMKKGESFMDTIKTVVGYADAMVIRHQKEGSARLATIASNKPIVNGGDGGNQHPTQTLIDLFTIKKEKGRIAGLNIYLVGDLKHARTMRSLLYALCMFGAKVTVIAPKGLEMERNYVEEIEAKFNTRVSKTEEMDLREADVLYVCRIQKERFADPYEAKLVTEKFTITKESLKATKKDLAILHPLPKTNEIEVAIDDMPQAKYFEQAHYGVPVRMAIMEMIFG